MIDYYPVNGTRYMFTVNKIQVNGVTPKSLEAAIKTTAEIPDQSRTDETEQLNDVDLNAIVDVRFEGEPREDLLTESQRIIADFYDAGIDQRRNYLIALLLCDKPWKTEGPATVLLVALDGPIKEVTYNDENDYETTKRINAVLKTILSKYKNYYLLNYIENRAIVYASMVTDSPFVDRYDSKDFILKNSTINEDTEKLMDKSKGGKTDMYGKEGRFGPRLKDENLNLFTIKVSDIDPRIVALISSATTSSRRSNNEDAEKLMVPPGKTVDDLKESFDAPPCMNNSYIISIIIGIIGLVVLIVFCFMYCKGCRSNVPSGIQNKYGRF